ncbi:MFS transporter [Salibacterium sp. K-3]
MTVINSTLKTRNYPLMTAILFWCGLVAVANVYVTIPILSVFAEDFGVSTAKAAWTGSAFSLFYAVGFLFFGPLSDRYGTKPMILFGLITLTVVSPIVGLFDSLPAMIILRSLQGVAAASIAPTLIAYATEMLPAAKRVTAVGFITTGFLMAGIVGQVFSAFVSRQMDWPAVFYALGIIYGVTVVWVMLSLPTGHKPNKDIGLFSLFKQMGSIFKNKFLILLYIITATLLLAFVGMYTALGNYLSENFGLNDRQILYVRSVGIAGMLLAPFVGRLAAKFGLRNVLCGGITLAVLGLAALGVSSSLWFSIIMSVVFVAGIALTNPSVISLVGQMAGQASASAVALYSFSLFIGATLGPIIAVALLKTGGYFVTFEILAAILGIGLIFSFLFRFMKDNT